MQTQLRCQHTGAGWLYCSWKVAENLIILVINVSPCEPPKNTSNCFIYLNTESKPEVQQQLNKIAIRWLPMYDAYPRLFKQTKQQKQFIICIAKQLCLCTCVAAIPNRHE